MFEDFNDSQTDSGDRARQGLSLLVSVAVIIGLAGAMAAAVATARVVAERVQKDVDISFASLPKTKAPKAKLIKKSKKKARKKAVKKQKLASINSIPDETPEEAEGDLVEAEDTGDVDGYLDGTAAKGDSVADEPAAPLPRSRPTKPQEQVKEFVARPVFIKGCRAPEISKELRNSAATIQIDVRMLISADGKVTSASVLNSHPFIQDKVVLECARAQFFKPAHLPDGTAVPYPFRRRFVFRPMSV